MRGHKMGKLTTNWLINTTWKVSNNGVFSGLYFPAFGPNMERYLSAFSPNTGKYVTEKTPYLDTFHAVKVVDLIQKISLTFINGSMTNIIKDIFSETITTPCVCFLCPICNVRQVCLTQLFTCLKAKIETPKK